jgi:CspA family cold shock protein
MARGTVKWFNSQKGYGFIQPESGGGKDVFVHISAVERAGLSGLNEGQVVEYEEVANKGKTSAENLKVQRWYRRSIWSRCEIEDVDLLTFPRTIVLIANTASVNKAPIVELKEEVFRAYESESRSHHIKRTQAEAEKL